MNCQTTIPKALCVLGLLGFTAFCVYTSHPVFAATGLVLTFMALAGRSQ